MKFATYYRITNSNFIVRIDQENRASSVEYNKKSIIGKQTVKKLVMLIVIIGTITMIGNSHAYAPGKNELTEIPLVFPTLLEIRHATVSPLEQISSERISTTAQLESSNVPSPKTIDFWFGGSHLDKQKLSSTIDQVIDDLNITAPTKKGKARKFLLEIAAIESDMGMIVKQRRGPAQGVFQILPSTFDSVLPRLKKKHPEIYHVIMGYYIHEQSKDWNRKHNIKFGAAFSLTYCYLVTEFKLDSKLDTRTQRAVIYKKKYNTNDHAYIIPRYHDRAKKHAI